MFSGGSERTWPGDSSQRTITAKPKRCDTVTDTYLSTDHWSHKSRESLSSHKPTADVNAAARSRKGVTFDGDSPDRVAIGGVGDRGRFLRRDRPRAVSERHTVRGAGSASGSSGRAAGDACAAAGRPTTDWAQALPRERPGATTQVGSADLFIAQADFAGSAVLGADPTASGRGTAGPQSSRARRPFAAECRPVTAERGPCSPAAGTAAGAAAGTSTSCVDRGSADVARRLGDRTERPEQDPPTI